MRVVGSLFSYLCLGKAPIALFVSLSAAAGVLLASQPLGAALPLAVTGVFLLTCGAGALNQYQERDVDARMPRTAHRPLPSGVVTPWRALRMSLVCIGAGLSLLWLTGQPAAPLLGLAAVLWYNGFYVWLKSRSAFAAIPGALAGAVPPAIGWTAGGGLLVDPPLLALCLYFFLWQASHFFVHSAAYGKEAEQIGRPSLTAVFRGPQLGRLAFQWLLAAGVSVQLFAASGAVRLPFTRAACLAMALWAVAEGTALLRGQAIDYARVFGRINRFMLAELLLFICDRLAV